MKKTKETKSQKSSNINTVKSSKLSFVYRPFSSILLVLRRLEFLGLYSYLKIQPSLGRRSSSFHGNNSIKRLAKLRITGYFATVVLLFLSFATISPIYIEHTPVEAESGTAKRSTLTYSAANTTASVKLNVTSKDGTFATSDENEKIKFTLSTNNATGYTLSIRAASNMDKVTLSNGSGDSVIEPLPEDPSGNGVSATTYASNGSAGQAYNNTWGYIPSYYHSSENTNIYYRAPNTTAGETLRKTNTANSSNGIDNADSYSIGLGIRANYAKASGTYTSDNVLVLEYVANPIAYSITFANDTGDNSIDSTLPATISGTSISDASVTLPSAIPTRTGYTFSKWCLGSTGNSGTTCTSGKEFNAGGSFGIDQTISPNSATLYAVWTINTYTITIARNDDGYGTTSTASLSLPYGTTLPTSGTTSTSITLGNATVTATPTTQTSQYVYSFTNWTHDCGAAIANNCTITANFTRTNIYTITWNPNSGSVSPTTTTRISGEQIGELPTPTRDGYDFLGWFTAQTGGTQISATTIVTSNKTYYAHWEKPKVYMQDFTLTNCQSQASSGNFIVYDKRDDKDYTVRYINGQCWMTQNLRFKGTSVPADTSNVTADKTLTYYQLDTNGGSGGKCYSSTGYDNACIKDSGSTTTGVWYNYYAATAGTVSGSSNSTAASQDICPKDWHLPSGPNTVKNTDFNKLVGNTTSGWQTPTTGLTAFGAVTGGYYYNGSRLEISFGAWWSATASNTTTRYYLYYRSTTVQFWGDNKYPRYVGLFVRCVRSS